MTPSGYFEGLVYHDWITEGRRFRLLKDLTFTDSSGKAWKVPRGFIVTRDNVPPFIQRWIADPFCARMRRATAVHAFFCHARSVPSAQVHRMFAEAMKADGVPWRQRFFVYWGLILFGDTWGPKSV